ncbi:MAG: tRNA epoxyqueuosine(34) reductase QueG [Verrucomicrobia bacterium]|nr:tRNA epoxyqueuosine(34) reductase QueG [Verrucomicrobiota bacterium]MBV9672134.1 tRNA epoxyqueuosine(34) reductase QueG [Verrucomicrobiota bacterium]
MPGYLHAVKAGVKILAKECGFDECRFARVDRAPHAEAYFSWLDAGYQAEMLWMERGREKRADPAIVLPGAKTLIILAKNYFQGQSPKRGPGKIARYAWGEDYHELMQTQMIKLDDFLSIHGGRQKCYVDTGPILERDFASEAGLSWHGKSSMSLNERLGTWFFLGTILTTLEFEPDTPARSRCGKCFRCMEACPTKAIVEPYRVDARRCISYLTIENKGPIPEEFRKLIGDRIYGCDDCLEVCPWNRFAQATNEIRFSLPLKLANLSLSELAAITEQEFRDLFRRSPIKRIKRPRFIRNVCVALGNVGTLTDLPILGILQTDANLLIAEHAAWAVHQIEEREQLRNEAS